MTFQSVPTPSLFFFLCFCLAPILSGFAFFILLKRKQTPPSTSSSWPRIIALNFLALCFFASTAFVLCESYFRFVFDTTDSFDYTFASKRWFSRYYRYNSHHLRDNIEYPEAIPPGARRITFLGDSFTVGHGVKNVDDRFANLLRKAHADWDVEVLAVNGLDTGEELKALQGMASQHYAMDILVLVYCLNDISDLTNEWKSDSLFDDWETRPWIVKNSYFANTWYFRLRARLDPNIGNYFGVVQKAYRGPLWDQHAARLKEISNVVKANGGQLVVVTFPYLHSLGPKYEYQDVHEKLGKLWHELDVPHLDLLSIYKDLPAAKLVVNRLDAHPNESAHRMAADAIDDFLKAQLKAVPPKSAKAP
jgi:hypothetical protein